MKENDHLVLVGSKIACEYCSEQLVDVDYYHKGIVLSGRDLKKLNICDRCLKDKQSDLFCYWKKRIKREKKPLKDTRKLMMLFGRLLNAKEEEYIKVYVYLLGLLLFRRKKITLTGCVDGYMIFTAPNLDKKITIKEVQFEESELERLTEAFLKFLEETE